TDDRARVAALGPSPRRCTRSAPGPPRRDQQAFLQTRRVARYLPVRTCHPGIRVSEYPGPRSPCVALGPGWRADKSRSGGAGLAHVAVAQVAACWPQLQVLRLHGLEAVALVGALLQA